MLQSFQSIIFLFIWHHITDLHRCISLLRGQTTSHSFYKDMENFQCFMLSINSRKMDMSDANDAVGVNVFVGKKPLDNDIAAFVIDIIQLSAHITE